MLDDATLRSELTKYGALQMGQTPPTEEKKAGTEPDDMVHH
jgi:hypothetical protein